MQKFLQHLTLARLHRPVGIWLLMWPSFWALAISNSNFLNYLLFFIGAVCMRSFGCIYNDMIDKNIDKKVVRTKGRPIASGLITRKEALISAGIFLVGGFAIWLNLNSSAKFASVGGLFFLFLYPWAKRFTHFPQVILGLSFSWGIIMAACQVDPDLFFAPHIWALYVSSVLFTVAYDTIYGFQDIVDDKKIKNKSTAIMFEKYPKLALVVLYGLTLFSWFLALNNLLGVTKTLITLAIFAAAFYLLIKSWRPQNSFSCSHCFYINHWLGGLFFMVISLIRVIP